MSVTISMTNKEYESLKKSYEYVREHDNYLHHHGISSIMSKYEKAKYIQHEITEELNMIRQQYPYKNYLEALNQARQVVQQRRKGTKKCK
jgi:hypothetical protein